MKPTTERMAITAVCAPASSVRGELPINDDLDYALADGYRKKFDHKMVTAITPQENSSPSGDGVQWAEDYIARQQFGKSAEPLSKEETKERRKQLTRKETHGGLLNQAETLQKNQLQPGIAGSN